MKTTLTTCIRRVIVTVVTATLIIGAQPAMAERLSDPIYRVAYETPSAQPANATQSTTQAATTGTVAVSPSPAAAPIGAPAQPAATANGASPFDLTQRPGEHPLMPVLRTLKATQDEIDRNVRDYCCTLVKQECVDGTLGEKQHIFMKVMNEPFSVYMSFLKPFAGREVLYASGQNDGKMVVLEAGFKRMLGKMNLDPNGTLAMSGQKHPITDVGIRNLTVKLTKMWEAETKFAECEVTTKSDATFAGRKATMIQVVHPLPRQDFRFHYSRLFLDNELKVPILFDGYLWPEQANAEPPLDEIYMYTNLKVNNGYTAREFSADNPEIFKK